MTQLSRDTIIESFRDRIQQGERLRLSKDELDRLIEGFIERLRGANTEKKIKALCETEIKLLEEGYPQASIAKYLTVYRKALKGAIEEKSLKLTKGNSHRFIHQQRVTGLQEERFEHWALTYLKYSSEVYETIDRRSQLTNRDKQLNLRLVPVERYLDLLRSFLAKKGSYEARWLATAIAGLTGRRFAEVMAKGTFSLTEHPYLLHFEGQLKTRTSQTKGYDIITLIPASEVLAAIERLRQLPEVRAIARLTGKTLSEELNRFNQKLNTICSLTLMQVVPPLEGKKVVSVHNLRSLYGVIAVYFFCPEHQHEYAFIQHFLGHVLDSPATGHYFRFSLCDSQGKMVRDKGVLLKEVDPLPLGMDEEVLDEAPAVLVDSKVTASKGKPEKAIARSDNLQLPKEWFSELDRRVEVLRREFEAQLQEIRQESNSGWFVRRVEALERENLTLRLERDRMIAQAEGNQSSVGEMEQLQAKNEALAEQLKLAQDKLDTFRQLLNGNGTTNNLVEPDASVEVQTETDKPQSEIAQRVPPLDTPSQISPTRGAIAQFNAEPSVRTQRPNPEYAQPITRGPKSGKAFRRAEAIVLAIKDWNRQFPSESFAINPGILETIFRVHRQAVKDFFEAYQNELWDYHQELGVESPRWHNRGKDTLKLKEFVNKQLQ
jgi:Telomere resolvase